MSLNTQWQKFTLSCRCQSSDISSSTGCESCHQQRKLWDTWPWAFSHCWGV
jgi:hypothetical protein